MIQTLLIALPIVNLAAALIFLLLRRFADPYSGVGRSMMFILSALGGGPAVFLCDMAYSRKATKENMMLRVAALCLAVSDAAILVLLLRRRMPGSPIDFFPRHPLLLCYLLVINIAAFTAYGTDKALAVHDARRVPIVTLLALAFFGGAVGGYAAMHLFRHKTQKDYFTVGLPLMMIMQVLVLIAGMTFG